MKRTVFCAALLLAAGCSSPKKNRTVDPLRVETIVARALGRRRGGRLCRCDRGGVFGRLELPRRRDRRPHLCGRGPARRQRSPARRARSHLGAPDFRGRRSRAESGEGRLRASETALRRREPARDQVGRGADPAAAGRGGLRDREEESGGLLALRALFRGGRPAADFGRGDGLPGVPC